MKYSEDIKLEIGGKFLNGDYHKDLKQLTKDLDRLIKSAKSEQLKLHNVVGRNEQLVCDRCKEHDKQEPTDPFCMECKIEIEQ